MGFGATLGFSIAVKLETAWSASFNGFLSDDATAGKLEHPASSVSTPPVLLAR